MLPPAGLQVGLVEVMSHIPSNHTVRVLNQL